MKRLLAFSALAAACSLAAASTWNFHYSNLTGAGSFFTEIDGQFSGADANANGTIDVNEVSAFSLYGHQVIPVVTESLPTREQDTVLDVFSFNLQTHALDFNAWDPRYGDAFRGGPSTGLGITQNRNSYRLSFADAVLTVTPQPVPEPSTLLMALAGLLGLGIICRGSARPSI